MFNIVEPENDLVRSCIVCGNIEMVGMDVEHGSKEHCKELSQVHENGKEFFVTNSLSQLGVIEIVGPEGHRLVVLDNIGSHLIAGNISVYVRGFIVVRVSKEAISCHKCFYKFEGKVHFGCPMKGLFPRLAGKRGQNAFY